MATYLVTGGAGFIGSHVVDALLEAGHRVRVLDNCSSGTWSNVAPGAQCIEADITDDDAMRPAFRGIDGVFHLAAIPNVQRSIEQPDATAAVNVVGTYHVLRAAHDAGVRRIVFASSAAVYGSQDVHPYRETTPPSPQSPYALQKLMAEQFCREFGALYGIDVVCLRYGNVYGPRMADTGAYANLLPVFLRQRMAGEALTVTGDGEQTRDFVHVLDVARATVLAMTTATVAHGSVLNVGSGIAQRVNDIARMIGGRVRMIPPRTEPRHVLLDATRARELLGWEPRIILEEGIRSLLKEREVAAEGHEHTRAHPLRRRRALRRSQLPA